MSTVRTGVVVAFALLTVFGQVQAAVFEKPDGLLFSDDFTDGLKQWKVVNGAWAVENGECVGKGYGNLVTGDDTWKEYVFEVKMKTDKVGVDPNTGKQEPWTVACLHFKYTDINNRYTLVFRTDGRLELIKRLEGKRFDLKQVQTGADPLEWNSVRVELKGAKIKVYLNGKLEIDCEDTLDPLLGGAVGFFSLYAESCRFDDVKVWEYDKAPPVGKAQSSAEVTASSYYPGYVPENAIDGKIDSYLSRWVSSPDQPMPQWLIVDFKKKVAFNKVYIHWDGQQQGRLLVRDYLLQYWNGTDWATVKSVKDNNETINVHEFPELFSDKVRLYITKVPRDINPVARLYEVVITGKDDKNLCSSFHAKFKLEDWYQWEVASGDHCPYQDMAQFWWFGQSKCFADNTKLFIDMNWSTETSKSIVPEDKKRLFGVILSWPYPLKKDTGYQFCLKFENPPDYVLVNNYKLWDIKENGLKDKKEILFDYIPRRDNEKIEITLVKDPAYGGDPIIRYMRGSSKNANIKYRKKFYSEEQRKTFFATKEKVSLPAGLTFFEIPGNQRLAFFEELHKTAVKWEGGFPERKDYPVDDCQVFIWAIGLPGAKLANRVGVDAFVGSSAKYSKEQLEDFNPKALLYQSPSAGQSVRVGGLSVFASPDFYIERYNHYLKTLPDTQIWVGYLEQWWRDRYLKNNPEWKPLVEGKNRFDFLRATFKINTEWKERILKKVTSPERVKFLYDTDGPAWPMAYYHHQGADILGNKNIGRQNGNIVLSNVRGAARAYGKKSCFTADPFPCFIMHQYSPDEYEQYFYAGYFGGADIIGAQCDNYFATDSDPNPAGVKLLEFAKFTKTHPKRGKQVIKIGVVRGFGDMWSFIKCPGSCELDSYRFAEHKDYTDHNLLNIFYPKFGDYKHTNPDRFFTGTPYGDIDMLPWDAPLEKLKNYNLLIYTGINAMDKEQYEKLKEYVRQGGKLIMACGHLQKEGGDIFVTADPSTFKQDEVIERELFVKDVRDLFGVELGEKEHNLYQLKVDDAEIISRIDSHPLVVKKTLGKGEAYLFASKHLTSTSEGEKEAKRLIQQLAEEIKLIDFSPQSDWLQYFIQKKDDIYILSFFNHGRMKYPAGNGTDYGEWKGEVTLKLDLPVEAEAFAVNLKDMSLKPVNLKRKGSHTVLDLSIDKKLEIIIGPKGKTKRQFFYGG